MNPILLALSACKGSGDDTAAGFVVTATGNPNLVNEVRLDFRVDQAVPVVVRCEGDDSASDLWPEVHVYRDDAATTDHTLVADGLLAGATYACSVDDVEGRALGAFRVTTEPLPPEIDFVDLQATVLETDGFEPGWTLINPTNWAGGSPSQGADLVVDPLGRIRWYTDLAGYDGIAAFEFDVPSHQFYGGGGFFHPMPFQEWDVSATQVLSWEDVGADHDVERADQSFYFITQGDDGMGGTHCLEERALDKTLLWSWCADEEPLIPDALANSLVVRDEGGLTYLYATMQIEGIVYKLEKSTGTIVWRFVEKGGDFTGDAPYADWMHDLHVIDCEGHDECLLFYDNGNPQSSIREIGIDESTHTATLVREWTEPGWEEPRLGGIEPVGNNWLIASGRFAETSVSDRSTQVVEVGPDDLVKWRLEIEPREVSIYRSRRIAACDLFHHAGMCPAWSDSTP